MAPVNSDEEMDLRDIQSIIDSDLSTPTEVSETNISDSPDLLNGLLSVENKPIGLESTNNMYCISDKEEKTEMESALIENSATDDYQECGIQSMDMINSYVKEDLIMVNSKQGN